MSGYFYTSVYCAITENLPHCLCALNSCYSSFPCPLCVVILSWYLPLFTVSLPLFSSSLHFSSLHLSLSCWPLLSWVLTCCRVEAEVCVFLNSSRTLSRSPSLSLHLSLSANVNKVSTLRDPLCYVKLTWSGLLLSLHTFKLIGMCEPDAAFHLQNLIRYILHTLWVLIATLVTFWLLTFFWCAQGAFFGKTRLISFLPQPKMQWVVTFP